MATHLLSHLDSSTYVQTFKDIKYVQNFTKEQTDSLKRDKRRLESSVAHLYLCHATQFFPSDGMIQPRMKFNVAECSLKAIVEKVFSIVRSTVHFTINSIVSDHSHYSPNNKQRFIVIDKFRNAQDNIVGGYLEDVFCIGSYQLSNQAEILVPKSVENDPQIQEKIRGLKGRVKIVYYNCSEKTALENWLRDRNAEPIKPTVTDADTPNLVCPLGKNRYISSQIMMETVKKTFCTHDITPMAQLETFICTTKIYESSPFLGITEKYNYKLLSENVQKYIQAIQKVYKLNESQNRFIRSYEKAILLALKILSEAKTIEETQEEFKIYEELIVSFDASVDLKRKIESHRATQALTKLTGLPFEAYYRTNCNTVVDAACPTGLTQMQSEELITKLKTKVDIEFTLELHGDTFYIAAKGLNLPEVLKKLK